MKAVRFCDEVEDNRIKYAVIVSRYKGKGLFVKHRERDTWECPGGHREPGEDIDAAARRELYEETGALAYTLRRVCAYTVDEQVFGMLYDCEITELGALPPGFEIEKIQMFDRLPVNWTYPHIQPALFKRIESWRRS